MANKKMSLESVRLSVSKQFHLRSGKDRIVFAGMVDENTYSIAQMKATGYGLVTWNLFFPKKQTNITIDDVKLTIESVNPEEIRFRVEG